MGYVDILENNIKGSNSLAANKKRLIDSITLTQSELAQSEQATKMALNQIDELVNQASDVAFKLQQGVRSDVDSANLWTWVGMVIATLLAIVIAIITVSR